MVNMTTIKKVIFVLATMVLAVSFGRGSSSIGVNAQEGPILHAWCWKFKDVSEHIDKIKDAGYVGVQVSPVQDEKKTDDEPKVFSSWWAFYQPLNFKVGNSLGTEEEFKKMCADAHTKNIKVIVDIVANHLANDVGIDEGTGKCDYSPCIDRELKALGKDLFHEQKGCAFSEKKRWSYTHRSIGMPDLNTANKDLQNIIIRFLNHLQELGADGFRFDAAKHIELPSKYDGEFGSDFWPNITQAIRAKDSNSYIYGEVLSDEEANINEELTKSNGYLEYMNLTENLFGASVCKALRASDPKLIEQKYGMSEEPEKLVTWVESHDTYAQNGKGPTFDLTDDQLKVGWAVTASRAETVPLFLVRPSEDKLSRDKKEVLTGEIGGPGNPLWYDNTIVQINNFKKRMSGKPEFIRIEQDKLFAVERGSDGMVIANFSEENVDMDQNTNLKSGKYIDKVSNEIFYVSNGNIKGRVQPHGVVVLYDSEPHVFISQEGGGFKGTLELTVSAENASNVYYMIEGEEEVLLPEDKKIRIGQDFKENETFSIRFSEKANEKVTEKSYQFKKLSESCVAKVKIGAHMFKDPYIYFYSDSSVHGKFFRRYELWPGVPMQRLEDGSYEYVLPDGWNKVKILVSDHGENQMPIKGKEGIDVSLGETLTFFENGTYEIKLGVR